MASPQLEVDSHKLEAYGPRWSSRFRGGVENMIAADKPAPALHFYMHVKVKRRNIIASRPGSSDTSVLGEHVWVS